MKISTLKSVALKAFSFSIAAFVMISCSTSLSETENVEDDDFSSTPPIQISGTYLTYENTSGIRCKYTEIPDGYRSECRAVAAIGSHEVQPVSSAAGVKLQWADPAVLQGGNLFESSHCRLEDNGMTQICDLFMTKGHAELDFSATVSESGKNKKSNSNLLFPYGVNREAGFNLSLPHSDSQDNQIKGSEAGLNFKEFSAFSGQIDIEDVCTVNETVYYTDDTAIYSIENGKIKALANKYFSNTSLSPITKEIRQCAQNLRGCSINLACNTEGMYVGFISDDRPHSLYHINKQLNASKVNTEVSIVDQSKTAAVRNISVSKMVISPSNQLYALSYKEGATGINKLVNGKFEHVVDLETTNSSGYTISSLHFDKEGNLRFLMGYLTYMAIVDGKPEILHTSAFRYKDSHPDKYNDKIGHYRQITSDGNGGVIYLQYIPSTETASAYYKIGWDKLGGATINANTESTLEPFFWRDGAHSRIELRSLGKDILVFDKYGSGGMLKMSHDPKISFEYIAGAPDPDISVPNTVDEFKKKFVAGSKSALETRILDLVDMVSLSDGSTVYLEQNAGLVKKVKADGSVDVIAGGGSIRNRSTGNARDLVLIKPTHLAVRPDDSVIIKDQGRLVSIKDGAFQTVAGLMYDEDGAKISKTSKNTCLNYTVTGIGTELGYVSDMVSDLKTGDLYLFTSGEQFGYDRTCLQKLSTDGKLKTLIHARDINKDYTSLRLRNRDPIYSALAVSPDNKLVFIESLSGYEEPSSALLPGQLLSIDLSSSNIKAETLMDDLEIRNGVLIANLEFGPNGEIFIFNSNTRSLVAYSKNSQDIYQKTSLFPENFQEVCTAGSASGVVSSGSLSTSLKESLSSICRGDPQKMSMTNTCSEADGRVSLVYSQKFGAKNTLDYPILGGNNMYRITWPCDANLFAE